MKLGLFLTPRLSQECPLCSQEIQPQQQMSINLILIYGHSMCPSCRQPVSQSKECETEYRRSWLSFVEGLKLDL